MKNVSMGMQACYTCNSTDHPTLHCPRARVCCMNCDSPGHLAHACPHPDQSMNRTCYNCGGKGHTAAVCSSAPNHGPSASPPPSMHFVQQQQQQQQQQMMYLQKQQFAQQQQHPGMMQASAWQPPQQNVRTASGKFRSSSVNSNSSYDSYYSASGFGNRYDYPEQELMASFASPSPMGITQQQMMNRITPPVKPREQSPFQPIYSGFAPAFASGGGAFEERHLLKPVYDGNENNFESLVRGSGAASEAVSAGSSRTPFRSATPEDLVYVEQRTDAKSPFEFKSPTFTQQLHQQQQEQQQRRSLSLPHQVGTPQPQPRMAATPQPATTHLVVPSSGSPDDDSEDKDKKKKRKKKKKKSKSANELDELELLGENHDNMRCFNCDGVGHLSRDCTQKRACFLCGETTHVAKQCQFSALAKDVEGGAAEAAEAEEARARFQAPESEPKKSFAAVLGRDVPSVEPGHAKKQPQSDSENMDRNSLELDGDSALDGEKKKNLCLNCSETGHRLKNCPYGRKCFQCGKVGHVARECPNISEAVKAMQKKNRCTPSPDLAMQAMSLTSEVAADYSPSAHGKPEAPSRMSSTSTCSSVTFASSASTPQYFPAASPASSPSVMSGAPPRYGGAMSASFFLGSRSLQPPSLHRESPPLVFGSGGAFSSFGAPGVSQREPTHKPEPSEEVDDSHLHDFVSHLLTDLDPK